MANNENVDPHKNEDSRIETDLERARAVYEVALRRYTRELESCLISSVAATGLDAGQKRFWASVLFTRLCSIGTSILWVCPKSKVNVLGRHWDFTAVGSLMRNLYECLLFFMYFTAEASEAEWRAKLKLMQLHDSIEREKMLNDIGVPQEKALHDETRRPVLEELETNEYFLALTEKRRKVFLTGKTPSFQTRNEIADRLGFGSQVATGIYRLFSSHIHSYPLGFYRIAEQKRNGVENAVDVAYSGMSLELGAELLQKANVRYRELFAGLATFVDRELPGNSHFGGAAVDASSAKTFDRNALCPCNSGQRFRWCHGRDS